MRNRKILGTEGEQIALSFIKNRGYTILAKNYRSPVGEIDIIARKKDLVSFIEVKTRQSSHFGHPEEAVQRKKMRRIIRTAQHYLVVHNLYDKVEIRFDVLSLVKKDTTFTVEYFENAFREEK
jgi:putative endonuclease